MGGGGGDPGSEQWVVLEQAEIGCKMCSAVSQLESGDSRDLRQWQLG